MRRIAIVGAGQAGAQLALGLLQNGYDVTLVSDRTPEQIRSGPVLSSQCMFETALQAEREVGLNLWEQDCPTVDAVAFTLADGPEPTFTWRAPLDGYAQSVDQRVKVAAWIDLFASRGGKLVHQSASVGDLEELARSHDLVVVAAGKGDLGRLFPRDPERSPYDQPQRALALTYVTGMAPRPGGSAVSFNTKPGVGEYFVFPALTTRGPCDIMVFEGVPGGPMDRWEDVRTPEQHLARSLELLQEFFPWEADRCRDVALTDDHGVLRGRLTPTVRRPVATLPSGAHVLGLGDTVVLNDPLTGQGSNNAAKAASFYLESILGRGQQEFTNEWMSRTFEAYWRGWAQWVVAWTNSLLQPPAPHVRELLSAGADLPSVAATLANGFDDPRVFFPWWFDPDEARRFIEEKRTQEQSDFDPRDVRRALGQYATGVTVVTCRGLDGHRVGMTANSFTSVSLDPPLVLWCPNKFAPSLEEFTAASHFAVNVLAADQHHLSRQFATPADDKFAGTECRDGIGGVPLLPGSVASFECRTVSTYDAGDHVIVLGEVERYDAPGGEPLVFHSGFYHLATKHPDF
jgi:flavin reductase (DIM6/NTAB) family NADH-FMN oxidoreductase RutF/2-polyprenyl-6-methoxyphenol hydroxylase-like FAD-dependent oxidoreductase